MVYGRSGFGFGHGCDSGHRHCRVVEVVPEDAGSSDAGPRGESERLVPGQVVAKPQTVVGPGE